MERRPDGLWIAARLPFYNANRNACIFCERLGGRSPAWLLQQAQEEVDLVSAEIRRNFSLYYFDPGSSHRAGADEAVHGG